MIWFTADYHLSHKNIIRYSNRPFKDVDEMDETILSNLKKRTKPGDILYYLGDLTFKKEIAQLFFRQFEDLEIHFIIGNHDSIETINIAENHCATVSRLKDLIIEEQPITLCHYAMRVWNRSHFNAWQLYGHSHSKLSPVGKQYDVGVDNNNFFPLSFEELKEVMKSKPNNFNFIPPQKRENPKNTN